VTCFFSVNTLLKLYIQMKKGGWEQRWPAPVFGISGTYLHITAPKRNQISALFIKIKTINSPIPAALEN
jgi:hypothetical protein